MNLRDLEYVLAIAKHGQFSQAALSCNVSQPALSNQVKKLERELGAELFHRRSMEVRPTETGKRVIEIAARMIGDAQRIHDIAVEHRNPEALPLKIGMTPTLAPYLTQYFADLLKNLFPKMKVFMAEDLPKRLVEMVQNRDLDFALIARKSHKSQLGFASIWSEAVFLAVRNGHKLAKCKSIRPEEVSSQQLIRLPYSFGFELEERLPRPALSDRREKLFDLSAMRFETVCRHLTCSDNSTIVSALAAEQFKRDNMGLSFIPFEPPGNLRDIGIIYRPGCPRIQLLLKIGFEINKHPPDGVVPTFEPIA